MSYELKDEENCIHEILKFGFEYYIDNCTATIPILNGKEGLDKYTNLDINIQGSIKSYYLFNNHLSSIDKDKFFKGIYKKVCGL